VSAPSIQPFDPPNRQQIAQGHPPDWRPPRPKDGYDLVVLGGGPGGLTAAITAATAGHAVAMVERNLTGPVPARREVRFQLPARIARRFWSIFAAKISKRQVFV